MIFNACIAPVYVRFRLLLCKMLDVKCCSPNTYSITENSIFSFILLLMRNSCCVRIWATCGVFPPVLAVCFDMGAALLAGADTKSNENTDQFSLLSISNSLISIP